MDLNFESNFFDQKKLQKINPLKKNSQFQQIKEHTFIS